MPHPDYKFVVSWEDTRCRANGEFRVPLSTIEKVNVKIAELFEDAFVREITVSRAL